MATSGTNFSDNIVERSQNTQSRSYWRSSWIGKQKSACNQEISLFHKKGTPELKGGNF